MPDRGLAGKEAELELRLGNPPASPTIACAVIRVVSTLSSSMLLTALSRVATWSWYACNSTKNSPLTGRSWFCAAMTIDSKSCAISPRSARPHNLAPPLSVCRARNRFSINRRFSISSDQPMMLVSTSSLISLASSKNTRARSSSISRPAKVTPAFSTRLTPSSPAGASSVVSVSSNSPTCSVCSGASSGNRPGCTPCRPSTKRLTADLSMRPRSVIIAFNWSTSSS